MHALTLETCLSFSLRRLWMVSSCSARVFWRFRISLLRLFFSVLRLSDWACKASIASWLRFSLANISWGVPMCTRPPPESSTKADLASTPLQARTSPLLAIDMSSKKSIYSFKYTTTTKIDRGKTLLFKASSSFWVFDLSSDIWRLYCEISLLTLASLSLSIGLRFDDATSFFNSCKKARKY